MASLLLPFAVLLTGFVLLHVGSEALLRGTASLAAVGRASPALIGLIVVAYGSATPDLALVLQAGYRGEAGLAAGAILGTVIASGLLILGIAALFSPRADVRGRPRLEWGSLMAAMLLFSLLAADGRVSNLDGLVLFALGPLSTLGLVVCSRRRKERPRSEENIWVAPQGVVDRIVPAILVTVGVGLLILGSRLLVNGSLGISAVLDVAPLIIGVTLVAGVAVVPRLTAVMMETSADRGELAASGVLVGNFHAISTAVGLGAALIPGGLEIPPAVVRGDLPVALAAAVVAAPLALAGRLPGRWMGALLIGAFGVYYATAVAAAFQTSLARETRLGWYGLAGPLMVIGVVAGAWSLWRASQKRPAPEQPRQA